MAEVTDIVAGLKTNMATILGAGFSELSNVTNVEANSFKGANQRYNVLSKDISETPGVTCAITVNQQFDLIVTDSYRSAIKNDSDKRTKTIALQELVFSIYEEVIKTKANTPASVIIVDSLTVAEPEYLEEDHVVVITATVTIKYRKIL